MRSLLSFVAGLIVAVVAGFLLLPDRVHFVVQTTDEQALREPPRRLEDDEAIERIDRIERSLTTLSDSLERRLADSERNAAIEETTRAQRLERQIAQLKQSIETLRAELAAAAVAKAVESTPPPAPAEANVEGDVSDPSPSIDASKTSDSNEDAKPEALVEKSIEPPREPPPEPPRETPPPPPRSLFKLIANGSKVGFDGSSNLHDFTGTTTSVKGEIEFRLDQPTDQPRAFVEIDATTLDTGNSSRDKDMHGDHLESKKWKTMRFDIESLDEWKPDGATSFSAKAHGTFTCKGKSKKVVAAFKAQRIGEGGLRVEGELPLKMSDFGITPPRSMGGLLRTHDDVRVWFVLQGRTEPPEPKNVRK